MTYVVDHRARPSFPGNVLADRLELGSRQLTDVLLIIAAIAFMALCSQVRIPLGFTPVPLSGQTFAVLVLGPALGVSRAAFALAGYLLVGVLGLPVFSGGESGLSHLVGPTGGYLVGFLVAAAVLGWFAERRADRQLLSSAGTMIVGTLVIYLFGVGGLMLGGMPPLGAIELGVLPFLIGDALKAALASAALPSAWAIVRSIDRKDA